MLWLFGVKTIMSFPITLKTSKVMLLINFKEYLVYFMFQTCGM